MIDTSTYQKNFSYTLFNIMHKHTWATIASRLGISRDVISMALGHGEETVTDVYIDFDMTLV